MDWAAVVYGGEVWLRELFHVEPFLDMFHVERPLEEVRNIGCLAHEDPFWSKPCSDGLGDFARLFYGPGGKDRCLATQGGARKYATHNICPLKAKRTHDTPQKTGLLV